MKRSVHKKQSNRNKQERAAVQKAFYHRMNIICERMVGSGYFELIPKWLLQMMFEKRYPPLRIRRATPNELSEADAAAYKRRFIELIQDMDIETLRGEKISFSWYLRDVLLLIHCIQLQVHGGFPRAVMLLQAFKPYFRKGEWYERYSKKIFEQFTLAGVFGFSFYKGILIGRLDFLPCIDPEAPNMVSLHRFRLRMMTLKVDENYRPLVQLASYKPEEGLRLISVAPKLLGFDMGTDDHYPLMIQQHVFNRFEERAHLPAGFVHALLVKMVSEKQFEHVAKKDKALWACYIGNYKIGYFLLSIFENCLIVRTFLLLTNQGTPEGNRLAKLTQLQLLDHKYLGIDRLSTFIEHDIAGEADLQALFEKAGCGSLLRYANEIHQANTEPLKNAAHIHRYLMGRLEKTRINI